MNVVKVLKVTLVIVVSISLSTIAIAAETVTSVTIEPIETGQGAITASIPSDVCQTASGLSNDASTSADNSVTYDTTPPPPIGG